MSTGRRKAARGRSQLAASATTSLVAGLAAPLGVKVAPIECGSHLVERLRQGSAIAQTDGGGVANSAGNAYLAESGALRNR
jgi:hypothetical protein